MSRQTNTFTLTAFGVLFQLVFSEVTKYFKDAHRNSHSILRRAELTLRISGKTWRLNNSIRSTLQPCLNG